MSQRSTRPLLLLIAGLLIPLPCGRAQPPAANPPPAPAAAPRIGPFARPNLVAWCIVPFDDRARSPEERAAMLERLGIRRLAYDYRAEHIPTFAAEIKALQAHRIELTAWWFPTTLNDEARLILDVLKRHGVRTQLWVTGGGEPTRSEEDQRARVLAEASRIRPIASAAAEIGCSVALYNHGGWFGEPENQLAIIEELKLPNVGIVYNQHHGHGHVDRFPELLRKMLPHLLALNLNGMVRDGDRRGAKIVPLGGGELDLGLLRTIRDSSYQGPIGILNHTQENAEFRLQDNLDGLAWLLPQLDGAAPGPRPVYRTWKPAAAPAAAPAANRGAQAFLNGGILLPGEAGYRQPPLTVECTATLHRADVYNILVASDEKKSGAHWEIFTMHGHGHLTAYLPGSHPDHVRSERVVTDGRRHTVRMEYTPRRVRLFVDNEQVADQRLEPKGLAPVPGGLGIGRLVEGGLSCWGTIDSVRISGGSEARTLLEWRRPATVSAVPPSPALPADYDPQLVASLLDDARRFGDVERGIQAFTSPRLACINCHRVGPHGATLGPELTAAIPRQNDEHLIESVLWPRRKVAAEFVTHVVRTDDGRLHQGYIVEESPATLKLRDLKTSEVLAIPVTDIEDRQEMGTAMPDGLTAAMTREQQLDLFKFLLAVRQADETLIASVGRWMHRSQVHAPQDFAYRREPLQPDHWPSSSARVNRDRIYDFYAKEAIHFQQQIPAPPLLPPFPGLDGGAQGHWGNQSEPDWVDGRWNETILGTVQSGIFRGAGRTVRRAICVRLGDQGELAACFDPETMEYPVVWKPEGTRFLSFSDVRHGFMHGLMMHGTPVTAARTPQSGAVPAQPDAGRRYLGFYRHGPRVLFHYRIGETEYLDAPWVNAAGEFVRTVLPRDEHPLRHLTTGGPPQSDWTFEAAGQLGDQSPFAVDTIPLPFDNPWKALLFCGGHAFLPDGTALVGTMQGDVWHVSGLDATLARVRWRRFASGLHHIQGVWVDQDGIFVLGRDRLTRLRDLNQDGEADYYESFSEAFETSPAGHDFICGLERDEAGRFYTASGNQGLLRIASDGRTAEVLATGFRNPDGLGLMPDGSVTVPCSEGDWTPASMICAWTASGSADGSPPGQVPFFGYGGPRNGQPSNLPLVYLPRGLDNSSGGQVAITGRAWAALQGNAVHLSFGAGTGFLLLQDEVRGQRQGAIMPLQVEFLSGAHRGRFHPRDGQLYVTGMAGWGSYTPRDGCFQRVRWHHPAAPLPTGFHVHENGIRIRFSQALPRESVTDVRQHFAQCWNYRYSAAYGSPELSPGHPGTPGHDPLPIVAAHVVDDGYSLFLEMPDLQPVNQLHLLLGLGKEAGSGWENGRRCELFLTVHALDAPYTNLPDYRPRPKTIAAHPILTDLALALRAIPNPWLKRNHKARKITLETASNLTYATRMLEAQPGEALALTLRNPDVVPHNWALAAPGSLRRVGEAANRLIADPEAVLKQYVPDMPEVLYYTDIVPPGGEFTIWITAPQEPGTYPYLCTFPGHWMVMHGELIVRP